MTTYTTILNGPKIRVKDGVGLSISQKKNLEKLKVPESETAFKSQRALAQYIGVNCRSEIWAAFKLIAQRKKTVEEAQYASLKLTLELLKRTPAKGHDFVKLDLRSMLLVVL